MSKPVPRGTPRPGTGPAGSGPGRGWRSYPGTAPTGPAGRRPSPWPTRYEPPDDDDEDD